MYFSAHYSRVRTAARELDKIDDPKVGLWITTHKAMLFKHPTEQQRFQQWWNSTHGPDGYRIKFNPVGRTGQQSIVLWVPNEHGEDPDMSNPQQLLVDIYRNWPENCLF